MRGLRYPFSAVVIYAAVALSALINSALAGEAGAVRSRLDPASEKAQLLKVQAGHAVWLVSQVHEETANHVARTYTHCLYLQRLGQRDARLVYQLVDTSGVSLVAVREDESVLLVTRRAFHLVPAIGPPVHESLQWFDCLAVYPDGLLVKDREVQDASQPVYFVPFDGQRLQMGGRVQVVDAGVKSFTREDGLDYPAEPYRFGDTLAWIADSTLHTFDLSKRERRTVRLSSPLHPSYRLTAFDGATVVCGIYAFDAATGELLGEPEDSKRPLNVSSVFAVRNRIGYYYDKGRLLATDLTAKDGRSVALRDAEPVVPLQGRDGLTIWDGRQWVLVPWLRELPQP